MNDQGSFAFGEAPFVTIQSVCSIRVLTHTIAVKDEKDGDAENI